MTFEPRPLPSQIGVRPEARLSAGFLSQSFTWMFAGLLVTGLVAWLIATNERLLEGALGLMFPVILLQLGLVVAINFAISRIPASVALFLFFIYSASMGVTISLVLVAYGVGTATGAFLSASAMFGGAALYGAVTGRSLASLGGYLSMALLGLIVAMLVNGFLLRSAGFDLAISVVGVLIFVGLTAWNVQKISRGDYAVATGSMEKGAVVAALALYLDFINLFLFMVRILGGGSRR